MIYYFVLVNFRKFEKKIGVGSRPRISASKRICVEGIIFNFSCEFCPDIDKEIIKSLRFQFIV